VDAVAPDPRSQASLEELRAHLIDAIDGLREHERLVATFYSYEGLTLEEIGNAKNLTECRISQLLKRALGKPRERQVLPPRLRAVAIGKRAWPKGRFAPVRGN
jgi:RNA polymerase sigma factor for flagellar operon FliA